MTKLHLGCGLKYLEGYVNIDYPSSFHSIQTVSVADQFCDITELSYKPSAIEEIRLHHVFEHFSRPKALALIASWNSWLQKEGILRIEVPDLEKSAKIITSPFSSHRKIMKTIRHVFGSHEAGWAYHLEGYTNKTLINILEKNGFSITKTIYSSWNDLYNIEIVAKKIKPLTYEEAINVGESLLTEYLVDMSNSEVKLLEVWLEEFQKQLRISSQIDNK